MTELGRELVVVVQDAEGTRHERVSLAPGRALLIGRGWHCDLIVQDKQVDSEHASLSIAESGEFLCTDLDSRNGTRIDGKSVSGARSLASGVPVRLGRARVTLYLPEHEVGPAVHPSRWEAVRELLQQPQWALGSVVLLVASAIYSRWRITTSELEADAIINAGTSALFGVGVWVLFWGVISKLLRNSMHFSAHLSIAATFGLLLFVVQRIAGFFGWQTLSVDVESVISTLGAAVLMFVAGVLTLGVATRLQRRSLLLLGAVPSLLLLVSVYLLPMLRDDKAEAFPQLITSSYPPGWRLGPAVALPDYVVRADSLYERSAERAEERALELAQERKDKAAEAARTAREAD